MSEQHEQQESQRLRDLLESQHRFPGPYTFKVIYRSGDGMTARICAAISGVTGSEVHDDQFSVRESSSAKFLSMTVDIDMQSAQHVLDVYAVLSKVEDIVSWF